MSEDFKPTRAMLGVKSRLHRRCMPEALQYMLPSDASLANLIAPAPISQLRKWAKENEGFWIWLLTPDGEDGQEQEARVKALDALTKILDMKQEFENGSLNTEVIEMQLKAAKLLLSGKPGGGINVNFNNLNAGPLPKGLKGMNQDAIQGRLERYHKLGAGGAIEVNAANSEGEEEI